MSYFRYTAKVLKITFVGPWQLADGLAGIIGIIGAGIAWYLPQYSSFVGIATWAIPIVIFAPLSLYRLIMAPYWVLKDELSNVDDSLSRLALIEESLPNIEFDSIRDAQLFRESTISEGRRRIYRLYQVWFKNNPPFPSENSIGRDVSAEISFTSNSDPGFLVKVFGQWMIGNPPDFVASGDLSSQIQMPPSHLPYKLNLVLKFEQDSWAHAFSRESLTRDLDGRDELTGISPGNYLVTIHLRGVGINDSFRFSLDNPGANHSLQISKLGE